MDLQTMANVLQVLLDQSPCTDPNGEQVFGVVKNNDGEYEFAGESIPGSLARRYGSLLDLLQAYAVYASEVAEKRVRSAETKLAQARNAREAIDCVFKLGE